MVNASARGLRRARSMTPSLPFGSKSPGPSYTRPIARQARRRSMPRERRSLVEKADETTERLSAEDVSDAAGDLVHGAAHAAGHVVHCPAHAAGHVVDGTANAVGDVVHG